MSDFSPHADTGGLLYPEGNSLKALSGRVQVAALRLTGDIQILGETIPWIITVPQAGSALKHPSFWQDLWTRQAL
jgi:hypothetical protein